jgi:polysaccharide chain length determinant protein (PEP-CTERM system associated)
VIPGRYERPSDYLRVLKRRRAVILGSFFITACAAVAAAWWIPARYKSETLILVVPQRVPESYVRSTITAGIEGRLQTITQQILSRTRLERVMQEFNLYADVRAKGGAEEALARMRGDISIDLARTPGRKDEDTSFAVSFVARDPDTAMRVTQRLASLYIDENLRDREVLADGTNDFLESQLSDARSRLVAHERRLELYRREHEGELPSQMQTNLQVVQNTQMQLQALSDSLSRDSDRRLVVERLIADQSSTALGVADAAAGDRAAGGDATSPALLQQLDDARRELQSLELRLLKPQHPDVIQARRRVERLELEVSRPPRPAQETRVATGADLARQNRLSEMRTELENLNRSMAAKEAQQQQLRDTLAEYNKRIEAVPTRESELVALTRDYQTLQNTYTSLLAKREDSKISAELERRQVGEQFKVLDPASLPLHPFSPNRLLIYASSIIGLFIGVGIALWFEYQDLSLRSEAEALRTLALPVLAMFPVIVTRAEIRRRRLMMSLGATGVLLCTAATVLWWKR